MAFGAKDDSDMLTYYRELAYYITRREQYDRALKYFDEALLKVPTDKRTVLGRSLARSKVCKYEGAIADAEKALELDPEDLVVTAQKALNAFLSCEFEGALVFNCRMVPKRKKPDNFAMGVMHCNEALENTIGLRTGHPLRDHYKIIRRLAWKKSKETENPFEIKRKKKKKPKKRNAKVVREPVVPFIKTRKAHHPPEGSASNLSIADSLHSHKTESDVIPPCHSQFNPMQHYTTNIENYMAERYLDSMYLDKMFLKRLRGHPGVISPNWTGSKAIMHMSKDGYRSLAYKQELLRTRRPFYFLKYQEAKISGALKGRILDELERLQEATRKGADKLLCIIYKSIEIKETRLALETAEKLKIYCELKPKKVFPTRQEYLAEMYKLVGIAYYQLFRINESQDEDDQVKRVCQWMGLPVIKEPSTDSVIEQFKGEVIDYHKQIIVFEERLRKATAPEEMCWLYHELARYHCELKQFELALVYSRKCIQEGQTAENQQWIINAMMMLCRINVQQHNKNDAKVDFYNALAAARQIGDATLQLYIEKCMEIVEVVQFEDNFGAKVLEKREKQIIHLMAGQGMKDEVEFLFRKMSVMPADRRMSVMPGVALEDSRKPTPSMRKATIMPTSKRSSEGQPPTHILEAASKSSGTEGGAESKRGVAFLDLIKYHIE